MGLLDPNLLANLTKLKGLLGEAPIGRYVHGKDQGISAEGLKQGLLGMPVFDQQAAMGDMQYAADAIGLGAIAGTTKAIKGMTKFEKAHKVAQKNAVEMLGLPPNNTAADRAKALGFDTDAYHATDRDWSIPDISKSVRQAYGAGIHSAADPDLANMFARQAPVGAQVMPLKIRTGNVADKAKFNEYATKHGYGDMVAVSDELRAGGYDTVSYPHGQFYSPVDGRLVASREGQDAAYASLRPELIRSRFAAFDPKRKDEADLLAAYFGFPMPQERKADK